MTRDEVRRYTGATRGIVSRTEGRAAMSSARATAPVEAIERAIRILDVFSVEQPELGVAEIARILGLKRSTVHRALTTLEAGGLLHQAPITQKYSLGARVLSLAQIVKSQLSLAAIALPGMRSLRDMCNETVALHLLRGRSRVVIQQVESTHDLRRSYREVGKPLPLHAGSPGKLLMAYMAKEESQRVIEETGLKPWTPLTVTDPVRLQRDLEGIRRQGYAMSTGQRTPGITSITCPIRSQEGRVLAGINISGPSFRFTETRALEHLPALREKTLAISRQLGYSGPAD